LASRVFVSHFSTFYFFAYSFALLNPAINSVGSCPHSAMALSELFAADRNEALVFDIAIASLSRCPENALLQQGRQAQSASLLPAATTVVSLSLSPLLETTRGTWRAAIQTRDVSRQYALPVSRL
jgi:hypothetical protein